jgi:non-heme chloroperoxidase
MRIQHTIAGGDGLQLNVMEWGKADGPAIFFIHGWSQTYMSWLKQIESALADEFRLVAMDLRGHGMSEAPLERAAYTESQLWADDVKAVIDALQLNRPVLVGWSYGGIVITDYLRAYGDAAIAGINFVGGAVQLNEQALGTLIGPGFFEVLPNATSNDLEVSIDAMRNFIDRCFVAKLSRTDYERLLCWNMTVRPDVRASLAARDVSGVEPLSGLAVPALVTQGRADVTVLPAMAQLILDSCPILNWPISSAPRMRDKAQRRAGADPRSVGGREICRKL